MDARLAVARDSEPEDGRGEPGPKSRQTPDAALGRSIGERDQGLAGMREVCGFREVWLGDTPLTLWRVWPRQGKGGMGRLNGQRWTSRSGSSIGASYGELPQSSPCGEARPLDRTLPEPMIKKGVREETTWVEWKRSEDTAIRSVSISLGSRMLVQKIEAFMQQANS